jgi:hypothetical protein
VSRPRLEVADILRHHGAALRRANAGHVSLGQLQVMSAIVSCRTAALGGHVTRCEDCAHTRIAYNSCRTRHCAARADGALATAANWGRTSVDLMVAAEGVAVTGFVGEPRTVSGSSYAAVRITALAACLLAAHPDWQAAELKAALFALARPPADPDLVAIGLIPASTLANQGACSTRAPASGV